MDEGTLRRLYTRDKKSVAEIAAQLGCSPGRINYWLAKFSISKRNISDAVYARHNPNGDPFSIKKQLPIEDRFLFGLGVGLYWGEGTKRSRDQVRLGNTDPALVRMFVQFLIRIYEIDQSRLRFGLQIFSDMDPVTEKKFWQRYLKVSHTQFYKTVITRSGKLGTYREKSKHGVLTVYFNNKKLRNALCAEIEKLQEVR